MLTSSQFLLNQQRDNVKDAIAVTLEEDPHCPQKDTERPNPPLAETAERLFGK